MLCRLKREESPGVATSGAFAVSAWILSLFLAAIIISYTSSHFKYTLSAVYFIPLASAIWHQLGVQVEPLAVSYDTAAPGRASFYFDFVKMV